MTRARVAMAAGVVTRARVAVAVAAAAALAVGLAPTAAAAQKPLPDPLMAALARGVGDGKAVLVVFHAEWCEPCNELDAQVLESARGAALRARVRLVRYEFDSDLGQAAARRLAVMSLPTALVLRPLTAAGTSATPLGLREIERVEGFEEPRSWLAAVDAALRRDPKATRAVCATWKQRTGPGHHDLLPCATTALRSPRDGATAAAWIEPRVVGAVPAAARAHARDAARALQRYWLRVRGDPARCVEISRRTRQLAAGAGDASAGFAYWHALCLKRAGQTARAVAVLEEHLAHAGADPKARAAARLLAADLLVHERIEPARARALLQLVVKEAPRDDEAWYLLARLARDRGHLKEARALVARARALAPRKALYRHFEAGLGTER